MFTHFWLLPTLPPLPNEIICKLGARWFFCYWCTQRCHWMGQMKLFFCYTEITLELPSISSKCTQLVNIAQQMWQMRNFLMKTLCLGASRPPVSGRFDHGEQRELLTHLLSLFQIIGDPVVYDQRAHLTSVAFLLNVFIQLARYSHLHRSIERSYRIIGPIQIYKARWWCANCKKECIDKFAMGQKWNETWLRAECTLERSELCRRNEGRQPRELFHIFPFLLVFC